MKKMFIWLMAFALLPLTSLFAQQNAIWSLPPKYVKFPPLGPPSLPIDLPKPTDLLYPGSGYPNDPTDPYDGYDGQISNFTHNAMQDANGDLLFFIVDELVYNKDGYLIDALSYPAWTETMPGYAETSIIPVPGSCTQYYIVGTRHNAIHAEPTLSYGLLDVTLPSSFSGGLTQGSFINVNTGVAITALQQQTTFPLNININNWHQGYVSIATTKLRSDNTRFLFAFNGLEIYRFKVTANGIFDDGYNFTDPLLITVDGDNRLRSEMEIIETTSGYRIALAYPNSGCSFCTPIIPFGRSLLVAELNISGTITSGNVATLTEINTSNSWPDIKGLEFSPNGNYVYVTHDIGNNNPLPFKIYDVAAQSFIPDNVVTTNNPQLIADIPAFKNSQIELGKDGKLYLANATSLATIDNADNPNALIWSSSALTISYNLNNLGFPITGSTTDWIYPLPDQIDGMNYTAYFTEGSLECCIKFSPFTTGIDMENNEHTISGTWDDNLNPYGAGVDIITVKDELIIRNGVNITANNLTFKFAPDAKLVIEQGATLTLNTCTLTVETTCENAPMWNGVEVLGNGTWTPQAGLPGVISSSGKFIANNSLIEHAYMATHNFKTEKSGTPGVFWETGNFRGGVILATNTTFRNNHRGTVFFDFQNVNSVGNLIDDESKFNNCTFITDDLLNKPALTSTVIMAHLFGVQSVNFYGCDFKTTDPSIAPHERGSGIEASNCLLTVSSITTGLNTDRSTFTDMTRGIEAYCLGSARTTRVRNTDFNNVWRCMYLKTNKLATILNNNINVASDNAWNESYGLYLDNCDKYKVEDNNFNTNNLQNGYCGLYVKNSGIDINEIYRNTFDNFKKATQAAELNGNGSGLPPLNLNGTGLEFRCNTYTNTKEYDILVSSGMIRPFQGNCIPVKASCNNKFSYTTPLIIPATNTYGDFFQASGVPSVNYHHNIGANLAPRVGTPTNVSPTQCPTAYNPTTHCPIHYNKTFLVLQDEYAAAKQQVITLSAQIDEGNTKGLTAMIQTQSSGNVLNALMAVSPYLSDEVLLAYLATNPPNGNLQQVLTANSPLSEQVMAAVQLLNLPKGIKTIVNNAQTGTSAMQELQTEIAYHENEVDQIKSDILRYFLFDDAVEERLKEAIDFLNQGECTKRQCDLVEFYTANKEYEKATQELSVLTDNIEDADYVKLFTNIIELEQTADPVQELATNPIKQQPIIEVAEAPVRKQESAMAEVLLKRAKLRNYQETIEELNIGGSGLRLMNQEENQSSTSKLQSSNTITVYPNPTSGEVNIAHNLSLENGKVMFKVYNTLGVEVLNENLTSTNNEVKINNLKAGVYFYTVTQNNQTIKTDKLMVR